MKRALIISLLLLNMVVSVSADEQRATSTEALPPGLSRLALTTNQQARVKEILDEHRTERQAMRDKMRQQLALVLTQEQQEKWQQFREAKRANRVKGRMGCEDRETRMNRQGPMGE